MLIETSLSDFHRKAVTIMKTTFGKPQWVVVDNRDYKSLKNEKSRNERGIKKCLDACYRILDMHAPHKRKCAQSNHVSYMNKAVSV